MKPTLWITDALIADVAREARESPRRRKNRNLHDMDDPVHRLLNALEPGTYIRPHRHLEASKAETAVVLSGAVGVLIFDETGALLEKRRLSATGPDRGVDMAAGVWHGFVALAPGTVFFETKAGPYAPPTAEESAPWAPPEGAPESAELERKWRALFA